MKHNNLFENLIRKKMRIFLIFLLFFIGCSAIAFCDESSRTLSSIAKSPESDSIAEGRALIERLRLIEEGKYVKKERIDDIKYLDKFISIDEFNVYLDDSEKQCLDDLGGSADAASCFVRCEVWNRELNIYYDKLIKFLSNNDKKMLKKSQIDWLKQRNSAIEFNSKLLAKSYNKPSSMNICYRASDADYVISPIIKDRVILLMTWHKMVSK